jgi:hypothetical protein
MANRDLLVEESKLKNNLSSDRVMRSMDLYGRAGRVIAGKTHLFGRRAELHLNRWHLVQHRGDTSVQSPSFP